MASQSNRRSPISAFVVHLHPRTVAEETTRLSLSFGLGGMAASLFLLLALSGALQLLSYSADSGDAYQSVIDMYRGSSPAGFVRNLHYWSANLLVIITFLHLLRVYLTGGLGAGRRLNWLIGLALFLLVLFANFTGYLLPWDQLAFWAVTIFTNMLGYLPLFGERLGELLRGATEVGPATLATFFAIHVGLVPPLIVLLLVFHFWLIRRAGGLVRRGSAHQPVAMIDSVPTLISKEAAVGLGLCGLVFLFSAVIDAPLGAIANPGQSPNPAKAAWYFMGLQELLLHFHPVLVICVIPALMIGLLALLPFISNGALPPGIWCGGRRGRRLALCSGGFGVLSAFLLVSIDELALTSGSGVQSTTPWISRGIAPLVVLVSIYALIIWLLRALHFKRSETIMALVLISFGIACGLTVVGIWFRGPGMTLGFTI
ncbi:MAG: cytochrome b N-terminal domain-containing protein [Desulfofustis sp.]